MRAQAVRKLYPRLEGAERFRLMALALSRADLTDVEHLIETAPRIAVVARDLEFIEASKRFVTLQARFDRAAAPLLGWLVLLDLLEPFAAKLIGEATSFEARVYADLLRGYLDGARRQALSEIKGLLQILDELGTEQFGLDGTAILAVPMPGCAGLLQRYREAVDEAEVGPEDLVPLRAELEWPLSKEAVDALS